MRQGDLPNTHKDVIVCGLQLHAIGGTCDEYLSNVGEHVRKLIARALQRAAALEAAPSDQVAFHAAKRIASVLIERGTAGGKDRDVMAGFIRFIASSTPQHF